MPQLYRMLAQKWGWTPEQVNSVTAYDLQGMLVVEEEVENDPDTKKQRTNINKLMEMLNQ